MSKPVLFICSSGIMLVLVLTFSFDSSLIPKVYATNLTVEQNTCGTTLNGFWDVSIKACITPGFALDSTDSLTIPSGAILVVNIGGTITNSGTINNNGGVATGGAINNNLGGIINNNGFFHNNGGTIINSGTIDNNLGSTFINSGTIDNYCQATLTNKGSFTGNPAVTLCNITKTTTALSASTIVFGGGSIWDQATLAGATTTPAPTGNIIFSVFSDNLCTVLVQQLGTPVIVSSNGVYNSNAAFTPPNVGTFFFQAAYSGDANNAASKSTCTSEALTVNQIASVTVSSLQNPSAFGQQVNFTATLSPSTATGAIQFQVDGTNFGSPVTLSDGTATLVTSSLSVGTHSVTASYGGDSNFAGSTSSALTQTVNKRVTVTSITPNPASVAIGKSIQFTATVKDTGAIANPSGHVTFFSSKGGIFSPSSCVLSSDACTVTYTPSSSGSITITGSYLGDSTHDTSSGTSTVTVLVDGHGHGNDDNEGNNGNHESGDNNKKEKNDVKEKQGHDNG